MDAGGTRPGGSYLGWVAWADKLTCFTKRDSRRAVEGSKLLGGEVYRDRKWVVRAWHGSNKGPTTHYCVHLHKYFHT